MSKRASATVFSWGKRVEIMIWGFRFMKPPVLKVLICRWEIGVGASEVLVRVWLEGDGWRRV